MGHPSPCPYPLFRPHHGDQGGEDNTRGCLLSGLFTLAALLAGCAGKNGNPSEPDRVPGITRPARASQADQADIQAVARGNNDFAFDLHREMARDGNWFFSPLSVSTALSMTYAGARGGTAKEMSKVLHYPFEGERLHLAYAGLLGRLSGDGKPAGIQLSLANALWGPFDYYKEFLAINRDCYAAHVRKIQLLGAEPIINKWAENHTAGRIKLLLAPRSLTMDSVLVLTNATYFKGEWNDRFKKSETSDEKFRVPGGKAVQVPMMHQTVNQRYLHVGEGEPAAAKILELPYKEGDLSMVIVLPDADDGIKAVERTLTAEKLEGWLKKMNKPRVRVRLPRFKLAGGTVSLKKPLEKLGMIEPFRAGLANFSGICDVPRLHIDKVLHQGFVEVNEQGSEAAAATAVVVNKDKENREDRNRLVAFTADHPFVFLIRDNRTGCILFLGRLNAPQ